MNAEQKANLLIKAMKETHPRELVKAGDEAPLQVNIDGFFDLEKVIFKYEELKAEAEQA